MFNINSKNKFISQVQSYRGNFISAQCSWSASCNALCGLAQRSFFCTILLTVPTWGLAMLTMWRVTLFTGIFLPPETYVVCLPLLCFMEPSKSFEDITGSWNLIDMPLGPFQVLLTRLALPSSLQWQIHKLTCRSWVKDYVLVQCNRWFGINKFPNMFLSTMQRVQTVGTINTNFLQVINIPYRGG